MCPGSEIISIIIDSAMKNATFSYSMIKVRTTSAREKRQSSHRTQSVRMTGRLCCMQGVYSPPRDDYATTPGNAQILFTCLPLMATWICLSLHKLVSQWSTTDRGQDQHVIHVT
jgi:hypothetical protein